MPLINSILTNIALNTVRKNLNTANGRMSCALERMSTGFKINSAKDDAAGCTIVSKTNVELSGLNVASNNAMHGIGMLNIADSALENMTNKVDRIRNLALKTMNSTYSDAEIRAIQDEINQLSEEIVREKETAVYNKRKIFVESYEKIEELPPEPKPYAYEVEYIEATGSQYIDTGYNCSNGDDYSYVMQGDFRGNSDGWSGANAYMQLNFKGNTVYSGSGDKATLTGDDTIRCDYNNTNEYLNVNGQDISSRSWKSYAGNNIKIGIFKLGSTDGNWLTTSNISGKLKAYQLYKDGELVRDYIPVVDNNGVACLYDKVSGQMAYNSGSGELLTGEKIEEPPRYKVTKIDNSIKLQIGYEAQSDNTIKLDLGFNLDYLKIDVSNREKAEETLKNCDRLIQIFSQKRSQIGSSLNRIDSIMELQNTNMLNLNIKKSLIKDTDIAFESGEFAKNQILSQVSTALFGQAKSINADLAKRLLNIN